MDYKQRFPVGMKRKWVLKYTLLYLIAALPLAVYFIATETSLVYSGDGIYQHYTILAHIRNTLRALFQGEGFGMISFQLGQGLDTINTLASHGYLSPLYLIAAFFSNAQLETAYGLIGFLEFYVIGFSFGLYLCQFEHFRKSSGWAVAAAGVMYAFCGYNLASVLKHPYFMDGALFLALMLTGVERLLQRRKWCMLSVVTAVMLVSNYYFAYKTAILSALYVLIRILPHLRREHGGIKRVLKEGFSLLGACCLGVALSAVVLLPVAQAYIGSSRTSVSGGYSGSLLHYSLGYYVNLVARFCSPESATGQWGYLGFCPLVLIAVVDLFLNVRAEKNNLSAGIFSTRKRLRLAIVITGIFLCVPFFGKMFNGFSYVSNRWSYGFALAPCMTAALWMLGMEDEHRTESKWVLLAVCLLALFAAGVSGGERSILLGSLCIGIFVLLCWICVRRASIKPHKAVHALALLAALCCGVYNVVSIQQDEGFYPAGVYEQVCAVPAGQVDLPQEGFYRLDTGLEPDNHSVLLDYYGTSHYWSVIPAHVADYYRDLQMGTLAFSYRLNSLGADSALLALSSAKYGVRSSDEPAVILPYGAEKRLESDRAKLYGYPFALELGYAFRSYMPESEYQALDPMEKRMALLSCAVVPDGTETNLPEFKGELPCLEVAWSVTSEDGAILTENTISGRAGDAVTLQFECVPDAEIYLQMDACLATHAAGLDAALDFETENGFNRAAIVKKSSNFYYEQQGICVNLGSFTKENAMVTLRFVQDGAVSFESLRLWALPMQEFGSRISALQAASMSDVEIGRNNVKGTAALEEDGILQIAIPYSAGWTAKVDGEAAEIIRSGGMYMGLALDAGNHEIQLDYCTPGIKAGAAVSAAAVLMIAALLSSGRIRRRKQK